MRSLLFKIKEKKVKAKEAWDSKILDNVPDSSIGVESTNTCIHIYLFYAFVFGFLTIRKSSTEDRLLPYEDADDAVGHIEVRRLPLLLQFSSLALEFGQNIMRQALSIVAPIESNEKPRKNASTAETSAINDHMSYKLCSSAT